MGVFSLQYYARKRLTVASGVDRRTDGRGRRDDGPKRLPVVVGVAFDLRGAATSFSPMGGLRRLRDAHGNLTDFWLSDNRSKPWTSTSTSTDAARVLGSGSALVDASRASTSTDRGGSDGLARVGDGVNDAAENGPRSFGGHDENDAFESDEDAHAADGTSNASLRHAPTVFVGYPHASLLCPSCRDVMLNPVVAKDGTTYCETCAPVLPTGALDGEDSGKGIDLTSAEALEALVNMPNVEVEDAIKSLTVLCRRALTLKQNATGASEWVWKPDGCSQSGIRLSMRDVHDRECMFVRRRCFFPFQTNEEARREKAKAGVNFCGKYFTKYAFVSHLAECDWRSIKCDVRGCGELLPFCKMQQHTMTCPSVIVRCSNGCDWEGKRKELTVHKAECPREYVKCGLVALDDEDAQGCLHGCERSMIDSHRAECDYRVWTCPNCDTQTNAYLAVRHGDQCGESRQKCPNCRKLIRRKVFDIHLDKFCDGASKPCAFASFGCLEHGTAQELMTHERQAAPRHLRLVVKALDSERKKGERKVKVIERMEKALEKFGVEYENLAQKSSERVRFVETKAIEEVGKLRAQIEKNQLAYDEHVQALEEEVKRLRAERDAASDIDAHLAKLGEALTPTDAQKLFDAVRKEITACSARFSKLESTVGACEDKWDKDISAMHTRDEVIVEACRKEVDEILFARSEKDPDMSRRIESLSANIRDMTRDLNGDIMSLSDRQSELEDMLRRANERMGSRRAPAYDASADEFDEQTKSSPAEPKPRRRFKLMEKQTNSEDTVYRRRLGSATLKMQRNALVDSPNIEQQPPSETRAEDETVQSEPPRRRRTRRPDGGDDILRIGTGNWYAETQNDGT